MAYPLKGDIRIEVRDGDGTIWILIEREKVTARHAALVAKMHEVIKEYFKEPAP